MQSGSCCNFATIGEEEGMRMGGEEEKRMGGEERMKMGGEGNIET